jgi:DNA repair protein RadC
MSLIPDASQPRRIRDLPAHDQPRARLRSLGLAALTDAELLAVLISAQSLEPCAALLGDLDGWPGLQRASLADLERRVSIGEARAAQIKVALEVARRLALQQFGQRTQINSPADAAQLLQLEMSHLEQEHLRVICLDNKHRVQAIHTVSVGTVNTIQIRVGEIFREPVRLNSTAAILVHNHPAGDPTPSPADVTLTRAVVRAGKLLDIAILDHLVIGYGVYVSMRERGLGFSAR